MYFVLEVECLLGFVVLALMCCLLIVEEVLFVELEANFLKWIIFRIHFFFQ